MRDIAPGPAPSSPEWLVSTGDRLVFAASDITDDRELWTSDGTEAGTQRLADLWPEGSSWPTHLVQSGDGVVFFARRSSESRVVWRAEPGVPGATLLTEVPELDIDSRVRVAGDLVYFDACCRSLWRTDGTPEGTWSLPAFTSFGVGGLVGSGGLAFFTGSADGSGDLEPWRTDGTPAGTTPITDLRAGPAGSVPRSYLPLAGGGVVFLASPEQGPALYRSDGTGPGTTFVGPLPDWFDANFLTQADASIVFAARDPETGTELWRTQALPGTTEQLLDVEAAASGSDPWLFSFAAGKAYFRANWPERWRTDGTEAGTVPLIDGGWETLLDGRQAVAGEIWFGFASEQLWKAGPGDETPGLIRSLPGFVVVGPAGRWSAPFFGSAATEWNGELWFLVMGSTDGLWRSDGTSEGTEPVYESTGWLSEYSELVVAGSRLFLRGGDGELWTSDGTAPGTRQVKDLVAGPAPSFPRQLVTAGERVFFVASRDQDWRQDLWVSDGTAGGTTVVTEIAPEPWVPFEPGLMELAGLAGGVIFADDHEEAGREAWWSDGTPEGTRLLEIAPGEASSNPREFVRIGATAYFHATDGLHGRELWKSDGTAEGTTMVRDIQPGAAGSFVRDLAPWGARLVFRACDEEAGCEPWTSDGTEEGTRRLADLHPGPIGSDPASFASDGVRLAFAASSEEAGREVWWVPEPGGGALGAAAIGALAALARRLRDRDRGPSRHRSG